MRFCRSLPKGCSPEPHICCWGQRSSCSREWEEMHQVNHIPCGWASAPCTAVGSACSKGWERRSGDTQHKPQMSTSLQWGNHLICMRISHSAHSSKLNLNEEAPTDCVGLGERAGSRIAPGMGRERPSPCRVLLCSPPHSQTHNWCR